VVKIAHEYRRAAFNLLDLIQEGNVGLMHAVQKYDPFRGVKLSPTRPGGSARTSCAT